MAVVRMALEHMSVLVFRFSRITIVPPMHNYFIYRPPRVMFRILVSSENRFSPLLVNTQNSQRNTGMLKRQLCVIFI